MNQFLPSFSNEKDPLSSEQHDIKELQFTLSQLQEFDGIIDREGLTEELFQQYREDVCRAIEYIQQVIGDEFIPSEENNIIQLLSKLVNDNNDSSSPNINFLSSHKVITLLEHVLQTFKEKSLLTSSDMREFEKDFEASRNNQQQADLFKILVNHQDSIFYMMETILSLRKIKEEDFEKLVIISQGGGSSETFTKAIFITRSIQTVISFLERELDRLNIRETMKQKIPDILLSFQTIICQFKKNGKDTNILHLKEELSCLNTFFQQTLWKLPIWDEIMKNSDHNFKNSFSVPALLDGCITEEDSPQEVFTEAFRSGLLTKIIELYYGTKSMQYFLEKEKPHNRDVNLSEFIENLQIVFEKNYVFEHLRKDWNIQVHFQNQLPPKMENAVLNIDDGSFYTIIQNCIRNACIHGKATNIQLTFSQGSEGQIEILIEDDGNGIIHSEFSGKNIDRIFLSGVSETGDATRGMGLGEAKKKLILSDTIIVPYPHGSSLNGEGAKFQIVHWPIANRKNEIQNSQFVTSTAIQSIMRNLY
ncbi:hypothetical protein K9L27_03130 [Candidatus Gracilibacteria bacterium]|nr:hypothetical protein [Candidatus Gracilibacteria bacterium]